MMTLTPHSLQCDLSGPLYAQPLRCQGILFSPLTHSYMRFLPPGGRGSRSFIIEVIPFHRKEAAA